MKWGKVEKTVDIFGKKNSGQNLVTDLISNRSGLSLSLVDITAVTNLNKEIIYVSR